MCQTRIEKLNQIINYGKSNLPNTHQVILFGSILVSDTFNDVDMVFIYERDKRLSIVQEVDLYASMIFNITQVELHSTLLNLEEVKTSIFYRSVKKSKHYYIKGSNQNFDTSP